MLIIINLPLVGVWVSLLRVPYRLLYPSIIVFCCIGIYSINNSPVRGAGPTDDRGVADDPLATRRSVR